MLTHVLTKQLIRFKLPIFSINTPVAFFIRDRFETVTKLIFFRKTRSSHDDRSIPSYIRRHSATAGCRWRYVKRDGTDVKLGATKEKGKNRFDLSRRRPCTRFST